MQYLFWTTLFLIFYTFIGYYFFLSFICRIVSWNKRVKEKTNSFHPFITVIIVVHNGEKVIEGRLQNLFGQDYPKDKFEILVASDGSMDATVSLVKKYESTQTHILDFKEKRGRSLTHNDAMTATKGEIIIFTDADTEFSSDFMKIVASYFENDKIGCVTANLSYYSNGSSIAESERYYFQIEKKIREKESQLGVLATASGPAMAIRKKLWQNLEPTDDADFTTPLDVILQG